MNQQIVTQKLSQNFHKLFIKNYETQTFKFTYQIIIFNFQKNNRKSIKNNSLFPNSFL